MCTKHPAWRAGATVCLASADAILPGPGLVRLLREQEITNVTLPPSVLAAFAVLQDSKSSWLDQVLSEHIYLCSYYDLIYAIDIDGRQISSNIYADSLDRSAYGQDLSRRPYSVSLAVLNNPAFAGAFLCDTYLSQVNQRPCVTLMYGVTSGPTALGFVAADLDPANLPPI